LNVFFSAFLIFSAAASAQNAPSQLAHPAKAVNSKLDDPEREKKAGALLRQMTLQEKIGQLVQNSAGETTGPGFQVWR
jgi:hypothetical protein